MSGVPSGWSDDGVTLRAPNGVPVVHGIRAFVLGENHDPGDVPLAAEQPVPLVEYGNQALGGGAIQFFLKSGQISYTAARNTFRTANGQEEQALRQLLADADAATAAAQANVTTAQGQRDALSAQLATAQSQIATLTAQLAAAQATPPTPTPAPPTPTPVANPAPTTPADAAALLVTLIYAEAAATLKAVG